jgi:hypothetical protein
VRGGVRWPQVPSREHGRDNPLPLRGKQSRWGVCRGYRVCYAGLTNWLARTSKWTNANARCARQAAWVPGSDSRGWIVDAFGTARPCRGSVAAPFDLAAEDGRVEGSSNRSDRSRGHAPAAFALRPHNQHCGGTVTHRREHGLPSHRQRCNLGSPEPRLGERDQPHLWRCRGRGAREPRRSACLGLYSSRSAPVVSRGWWELAEAA